MHQIDYSTVQESPRLLFQFDTKDVTSFTQQTVWPFRIRDGGLMLEIIRNEYYSLKELSSNQTSIRPIMTDWQAMVYPLGLAAPQRECSNVHGDDAQAQQDGHLNVMTENLFQSIGALLDSICGVVL